MSDWFKKNLRSLLPPFYSEGQEGEDLRTLLDAVSPALDDLKGKIDGFGDIFDVDKCDPKFLSLLGEGTGVEIDGKGDPADDRRRIRESVERSRRKGTLPAMNRSLVQSGWDGRIEETFRSAARLVRRASLNNSKLSGRVYNLGVYRVHSNNQNEELRELLRYHHPAGTRAYMLQWLLSFSAGFADTELFSQTAALYGSLGESETAFKLNNNALGCARPLTKEQRTGQFILSSAGVLMLPQTEAAAVKISRNQGRKERVRCGTSSLNQRRIANADRREVQQSFCTEVYTGKGYDALTALRFSLNANRLNGKPLPLSEAQETFCFRQKDVFDKTDAPRMRSEGHSNRFSIASESRRRSCFQPNQTRLNGRELLNTTKAGLVNKHVSVGSLGRGVMPQEAGDRVDRFQTGIPVFDLGNACLNGKRLTHASVDERRAAFEIAVNTERVHRGVPLSLGSGRVNAAPLSLHPGSVKPMRLGSMKLGQSGFKRAEPDFRWLIRQKDFPAFTEAETSEAVNRFKATEHPTAHFFPVAYSVKGMEAFNLVRATEQPAREITQTYKEVH